jgi:histone-binding protein RBBP4
VWDIRHVRAHKPLYDLCVHTRDVLQVSWAPLAAQGAVIASLSADRRVCLWDLRRAATRQPLAFIHGGHTTRPADLAWHPTRPLMAASTAEDNSVHVWQPNSLLDELASPASPRLAPPAAPAAAVASPNAAAAPAASSAR